MDGHEPGQSLQEAERRAVAQDALAGLALGGHRRVLVLVRHMVRGHGGERVFDTVHRMVVSVISASGLILSCPSGCLRLRRLDHW